MIWRKQIIDYNRDDLRIRDFINLIKQIQKYGCRFYYFCILRIMEMILKKYSYIL